MPSPDAVVAAPAGIDYDWKESETKDQTQTRAGFEFGSKSTVTAEGNVTIGLDAVSNLSGAVDLIYPVRVKVTTPAPDSFAPGDWVTITAEAEVLDGVRMETASHKTEIKIGAVMAAKVTGEGKVCNFVCSPPQELFDPVNLVETEDIIFDSTDITSRIVFPPIIASIIGIGGSYEPANVLTETSSANEDGSLESSGDHRNFADLSFDIDAVLFPGVGILLGFDTGDIAGVQVEWQIIDVQSVWRLSQQESFTFAPTVHIKLDFGAEVDFRLLGAGHPEPIPGTGQVVSISPGDVLEVKVPEEVLSVSPTFSQTNSFTHTTGHTLNHSFVLTTGEFQFKLPSAVITEGTSAVWGCDPFIYAITFGAECKWVKLIPAIPAVTSPAIDFHVGPAFEVDLPTGESSLGDAQKTFELGGFNDADGGPFSLDPEFAPVAVIDGPDVANEGDLVAFEGDSSSDRDDDPLTYNWFFDGVFSASSANVDRAFVDDGVYQALLRVEDDSNNTGTDTHSITILNAPPELEVPRDTRVALEGETVSLAKDLFYTNLLENSGAEEGTLGWTAITGGFGTHAYGPPSAPIGDWPQFGDNLISNPGAESGTSSWSPPPRGLPLVRLEYGAPPDPGPLFNANLIVNGNAETGDAHWSEELGDLKTVAYGTGAFPGSSSGVSNPGVFLFYGDSTPDVTARQTVNLSQAAVAIDDELVDSKLFGFLGGFSSR